DQLRSQKGGRQSIADDCDRREDVAAVAEALSLALDIFGLAAGAALMTALVLAWAARRIMPPRRSGHFIGPCAAAIGFFAGYAMLPRDWAGFRPDYQQPWTWLPYLGLVAASFAAAFPPSRRSQAWKFVLIVVAPIAAACLTPNWPVFGLTRERLQWVLVVYLLLVGVPLQYLPARVANKGLLAVMTAAAVLTAIASGAMVAIRFGQLAAIAAGALAGTWIAGLASKKRGGLPAHGAI